MLQLGWTNAELKFGAIPSDNELLMSNCQRELQRQFNVVRSLPSGRVLRNEMDLGGFNRWCRPRGY